MKERGEQLKKKGIKKKGFVRIKQQAIKQSIHLSLHFNLLRGAMNFRLFSLTFSQDLVFIFFYEFLFFFFINNYNA